MYEQRQKVKELVTKAAGAEKADEAMKFSQAAVNVANALRVIGTAEEVKKD